MQEKPYICYVNLARPSPPFPTHPINYPSSFYSEVRYIMEEEPFMWIKTIPDMRIFGSNNGTRDLQKQKN